MKHWLTAGICWNAVQPGCTINRASGRPSSLGWLIATDCMEKDSARHMLVGNVLRSAGKHEMQSEVVHMRSVAGNVPAGGAWPKSAAWMRLLRPLLRVLLATGVTEWMLTTGSVLPMSVGGAEVMALLIAAYAVWLIAASVKRARVVRMVIDGVVREVGWGCRLLLEWW